MFSNQPPRINGVTLPKKFASAQLLLNNIAISKDGKSYAHVDSSGRVTEGECPVDGALTLGRSTIQFTGGRITSVVGSNLGDNGNQRSSISLNLGETTSLKGVSVTGCGDISFVADSDSPFNAASPAQKSTARYSGVSQVRMSTTNDGIFLDTSASSDVTVTGAHARGHSITDGVLELNDFGGSVTLPQSGVSVHGTTVNGSIKGRTSASGRLKTENGDIKIELSAPIELRVKTVNGECRIKGMKKVAGGVYRPPHLAGDTELPTLQLTSRNGDIKVKYSGPVE